MADPCLSVEVVVGQCVDAAVGPLLRDPLHVSPVKAVVAGKNRRSLQEETPIGNLSPHVEADLFPGVNRQPNPLQLHWQDPRIRCQFVPRPMLC